MLEGGASGSFEGAESGIAACRVDDSCSEVDNVETCAAASKSSSGGGEEGWASSGCAIGGVTATRTSRLSAHFDKAAFFAIPLRTWVITRSRVVACSLLGLSSPIGTPRQGARGAFLSIEDTCWAFSVRTLRAITSLM